MADESKVRLYLKQWMSHLGVTQEELSGRTGYTQSSISEIANGKKRWNQDHLAKFAQALELDDPAKLLRDPDNLVPIFMASKPLDKDRSRQIHDYIRFVEAQASGGKK